MLVWLLVGVGGLLVACLALLVGVLLLLRRRAARWGVWVGEWESFVKGWSRDRDELLLAVRRLEARLEVSPTAAPLVVSSVPPLMLPPRWEEPAENSATFRSWADVVEAGRELRSVEEA